MKLNLQKITSNNAVNRLINLWVISILNLLFILLILLIASFLSSHGLKGRYFILLIIIVIFSILPLLNFFLDKLDSVIYPAGYDYLYFKMVDLILSIASFDEIIHKIFSSVIKFMKAGSGCIVYYSNETDAIEIQYKDDGTYKISYHERTESDDIFIKSIKGPDEIITKTRADKQSAEDKKIMKAFEQLDVDIIVPIYYNNKKFGIIMIGQKRGFSEREIKLLKIVAYKLAQLSVNSFYFSEIRKGREVEKEYELISRIQKQFLPEPRLNSGRINIKAYHDSASSLTREFYDIFVNDALQNDIRISAYRVSGDVKEISILMPGIQAMLQCYARLGFSPRKTMSKLKSIVKERNLLSGDLMIFHSSIQQSGEFICCCSNYPAPFLYKKSKKELIHLKGGSRSPQYIRIKIEPGDIIFAVCGHYSDLVSRNMSKYKEIFKKNHNLPLDTIMDLLVKKLNISHKRSDKDNGEDKLIILVTAMEEN